MRYTLFALFFSFTSLLFSSEWPTSETGNYTIAESITGDITIPIADFERTGRTENRTGDMETYQHLRHQNMKFYVFHDRFTHFVDLESYADWFTKDIDAFDVLHREVIYGGARGNVPIFHQILADREKTLHQLFIVRGYCGMGIVIPIARDASIDVQNFWDKVLDDAIDYIRFTQPKNSINL